MRKNGRARIVHRAIGGAYVLFCLVAVVLAMGSPGIGWMLHVILLYAGGFSAPRVGRGYLLAGLALGLLNLVTLGPLAGFGWAFGFPGWGVALFLVVFPLATACAACCLPGLWTKGRPAPAGQCPITSRRS